MDKGTLLEWKVAPGTGVAKGDVVAVVDTSKAAVDVEIWRPGTVRNCWPSSARRSRSAPRSCALAPGERRPAGGRRRRDAPRRARAAAAAASPRRTVPAGDRGAGRARRSAQGRSRGDASRRASGVPAARRAGRELGLDLAGVTGTGAEGR